MELFGQLESSLCRRAEPLDAYLTDTTRGAVYDYLMNISYAASLAYRIGVPLPDTGLVKPGIPIPTTNNIGQFTATITSVVPNPVTTTATIIISLPEKDDAIRLILYDALGNASLTIAEGSYRAGQYLFTMSTAALRSGIYHLRLSSRSGGIDMRKIIIVE